MIRQIDILALGQKRPFVILEIPMYGYDDDVLKDMNTIEIPLKYKCHAGGIYKKKTEMTRV